MSRNTTFRVKEFEAFTKKQATAFVQRGQLAGQRELREILGPQFGARTGREYTKGGKTHTASAPGEAPAVDSGRLRQSALMHPIDYDGSLVIGSVGVATDYAEALELGTEKMEPRPFVSRLATEKERVEKISRIAAQTLKNG